jgi:PAS domain S-box-containing protein
MWEYLASIFDTQDFPARWHCGNWSTAHGWLHILSDLGVWSAYVAIPCVLSYFLLRRKDLPFPTIIWLFVAFILACGTTHLMEAIIFWWPAYRLAGLIKLMTALVSWATIFALVSITPKVLSLASPTVLEERVNNRTRELAEANEALQRVMQEQMKTEASLLEQHEWFLVTLSSLGEGVIATDSQGKITFVNIFATKLTGWSEKKAIGKSLNDVLVLIDSKSGELLEIPQGKLLGNEQEGHFRLEAELRSEDSRSTPIEFAATPIRSGNITLGVVVVLHDATERQRREVEQLEANERIRSVVDHVVDGIITIDDRGNVTSFNPAAERIFGRNKEEVIDQNVRVLMPEPYHSQHDGYLHNYLMTNEAKIIGIGREVVGRRKDGSTFPLDLAVSEFRLDRKRYFTGIVRDITDRKQAEKTSDFLANAGDVLATLVDFKSAVEKVARLSVPFLADFCIVDLMREDGSFYRACAAHADPGQELLMQVLRQHGELNPADESLSSRVARNMTAQRLTSIESYTDSLAATHADELEVLKKLAPRSLICVPLLVRNRTLGTITFVRCGNLAPYSERDLTLAEDLAHRAAIAVDNAGLYEVVCNADRRKDEFLATIAHELRNPLAPIRHALEVMRISGSQEELPSRARETVQRQIDHLVRLVDDLLDVSRIMQGKIELRHERFKLTSLIERVVESTQHSIRAHNHDLSISVPSETVWLVADATRLDQVISNLLNNAAKYTDPGGKIELNGRVEGEELILSVKDNGIGIETKLLGDVFDLFRQVDTSFSRSRGGLGIGLTLARSLVQMHGGTIEAHSAGLGKGSEFVVRLPLPQEAHRLAGEGKKNESAAHVRQSALRILVVDDNVDAADMLATVLRLDGHEVQTAYDGFAALIAAKDFRPTFVLLDIGMPGMSGYEVAMKLREEDEHPSLVLIAMTGFGQEQDRRRSREAGIDHHLVKPVSPDTLRQILSGD